MTVKPFRAGVILAMRIDNVKLGFSVFQFINYLALTIGGLR